MIYKNLVGMAASWEDWESGGQGWVESKLEKHSLIKGN